MNIKLLFRINGASCVVFGLAMVLMTDAVNQILGSSQSILVQAIGVVLIFNGCLLGLAAMRKQARTYEIMFFVLGDYGWTLLTIALISVEFLIVDPLGIRISFVIALYTAAMGALQFKHYKVLKGRA